jgi:hypothetical protein
MRSTLIAAVLVCGAATAESAPCPFDDSLLDELCPAFAPCSFDKNRLDIQQDAASLVVRLENPPRTKVVLTVDGVAGFYRELVWDPAAAEGLQHDLLLPKGEYRLMAFADDDRVQTSQTLLITSFRFFSVVPETKEESAKNVVKVYMPSKIRSLVITNGSAPTFLPYGTSANATSTPSTTDVDTEPDVVGSFVALNGNPELKLTCDDGRVDLARLQLNTKELQAGSVSRGFLDQAAPAVVTDTLALIAEIALDRAKAGAMKLVRERFVEPICRELDLQRLGLGTDTELAFPRACSMLREMHIEDLLSSGRSLIEAVRDDVRMTLLPRVIAKLDLPPVARDVAKLALRLGNEMLEGGGNESAALDLVVAQMDRILRLGAANGVDGVKQAFIDTALGCSAADVEACKRKRDAVLTAILERFLPADPGELLSRYVATKVKEPVEVLLKHMQSVKDCKRPLDNARSFIAADKEKCVAALVTALAEQKTDWLDLVKGFLPTADEQLALIEAVKTAIKATSFDEWLETNFKAVVFQKVQGIDEDTRRNACALRVAIGVVKWCSGRDKCTAADIGTAIAKPETLFAAPAPGEVSLEALCWKQENGKSELLLPVSRGPFVELASRALAFLTPPPKGEERQRVLAVLRWMFDVAKIVDPKSVDSSIQKIEEIVDLFAQRAYVRAVSQTVLLSLEARKCKSEDCMPTSLKMAMKLIGAVGSYLQVYDETRDKDAAEAKAARKKAIEKLIDASTDRRERAGQRIFSLGIPVGLTGGARWAPASSPVTTSNGDSIRLHKCSDDSTYIFQCSGALAWRLPLALALQRMPRKASSVGWHVAFTFADLGNFVRGDANGAGDDIEWKDFVQFGVQGGLTFGNGQHLLVVAADASWSPGLYERDVVVNHPGGGTEVFRRSGALLLGLTLAYYVPLFDLN